MSAARVLLSALAAVASCTAGDSSDAVEAFVAAHPHPTVASVAGLAGEYYRQRHYPEVPVARFERCLAGVLEELPRCFVAPGQDGEYCADDEAASRLDCDEQRGRVCRPYAEGTAAAGLMRCVCR